MTSPDAPAKQRQRGRPKLIPDDAQRRMIADCARELFLERGYGRTTTEEVAARCRISKHTLYRLFPGKPALFAAIVDVHRHSMLALPGDYDGLPLDRALERIFQIDIDPEADRQRVALLRLVLLEAHQSPELGDIVRRHGADKSRAELADWLAARAKTEAMVIDHFDSAARILMDMIFGAVAFKT
ncbi:TetR/AcrR family transcriptional regulator, partial [Rhodopseudomonas palustris]